ncbi:hypothetical protein FEK35_11065 [Nocardia cyriacigeorgica]|uniref:YCII-related domain-containing protein n=1 Tax=Nocardia cyriacigeorgica TaxID=135487 RepID=A0A5R8PF64_9NOCA|nr:YciI family protein [Nocardia cyriacigeorgica]TLG12444.1 hypothetical protein FEK35_11065 [Nocardia cyriacigeorgica]
MKYMLIKTYGRTANCDIPINEWAPEDIAAHIDFQRKLSAKLAAAGELVDAKGLAGPEEARIVSSDGRNAPVITDGPFPETKEFLAGYWIVDVDSQQRALDIAAEASAAPGPGGEPIGEYIEVRAVMSAPAADR